MPNEKVSFEDLIQKRLEQKEIVAAANKKAEIEKTLLDDIEAELLAKMEEVGTETCGGCGYSVTVREEDVPDSTDWETFIPFLLETGNMHLLQRRISTTAWREYNQIYGEFPPGTHAFAKKSLSFNKKATRKRATSKK